ncbi:MAG: hypothetical protein NVS2B2_16940 [Ktedonobacteraceae bacterium]
MKRSFLARLRSNGTSYLCGALLLLAGIPAYQAFVLAPLGYNNALVTTSAGNSIAYLVWIGGHQFPFLLYRVLLLLAFILLLSLPFSLFRVIIAQELMGQEEREAEEDAEEETEGSEDEVEEEEMEVTEETEGMPPYAWRGKGFAVIAAWSGLFGLICYIAGTLASTLYLATISNGIAPNATLSSGNILLISIFAIMTNTLGVGLLALSTLFFGAIIARSGAKLWPFAWVIFGYIAFVVAALFSGSAVSVASAPASGQAPLTAPAILLFGVWVLWLGVLLYCVYYNQAWAAWAMRCCSSWVRRQSIAPALSFA